MIKKNRDAVTGENTWQGPKSELAVSVLAESSRTLEAYRAQPNLVIENANHEGDTARGGYAHRQLFELIQNSADALAHIPEGGRIVLQLTEDHLYCGDDGLEIDSDGVKALMFSHLSPKRGTSQIGRFGLGFKSVLGITDTPEFFSRSGSFRFDRRRSRERISKVAPNASRYPVLRLADPIDPIEYRKDRTLCELMGWARNIVRLPLKPDAHEDISQQMCDFPPEFLLFVEHVRNLTLCDSWSESKLDQTFELRNKNGEYHLRDSDTISRWKLFKVVHTLTDEAKADRLSLDDNNEVPIWWAVSPDRLTEPGRFWAFFPTETASLVAGYLNAPWKTNEDRQNLLPGPYNDELIKSAARLIADSLPDLATRADPARHLDALPRRRDSGDTAFVNELRDRIYCCLKGRDFVPDQEGRLRSVNELHYPPKELISGELEIKPLERWAAYPGHPVDWLNLKALTTRHRRHVIETLRQHDSEWTNIEVLQNASIQNWLEALVEDHQSVNHLEVDENQPEITAAIQASMAAVQTAALVSYLDYQYDRQGRWIPMDRPECFGHIVLTASFEWHPPDPARIFLPDQVSNGQQLSDELIVHPKLTSDLETLNALRALGLKPPSPESSFRRVTERVLTGPHSATKHDILPKFWQLARTLNTETAWEIIGESVKTSRTERSWSTKLRVRAQSGEWQPLHSVLLPGAIVPGDDSRDDQIAVDMDFHGSDLELLEKTGVTDGPRVDYRLCREPCFYDYRSLCRRVFRSRAELRQTPQVGLLVFKATNGAGPLQILTVLSEEGKARYTEKLLSLSTTYEPWEMRHSTRPDAYSPQRYDSLTIHMLRKHGRIRTPDGSIVPFKEALGQPPNNQEALITLLTHQQADLIRKTFDLAEPTPEFIGEEDPVPLIDIWPGLIDHLPLRQKSTRLVQCEQIRVGNVSSECVFYAPDIYLSRTVNNDDVKELRLVSDKLGLNLSDSELNAVLDHRIREETEKKRAEVRAQSTDAERLLKAAGEDELRRILPNSLLTILENDGIALTPIQVAEAAIATYHTDALRQCRENLNHLFPPNQWAGSKSAVEFVRSLGFSVEWAGERKKSREPYLEVDGPYSLPELHDFQRAVVNNVREMLRNGHRDNGVRRGMISMPTGSGKTRVAVQAVIEAITDDGFKSGILWVADRDELCEQAVEAWRQVWSNIGTDGSRLRISRMWAGQPEPQPTSDFHVVIATIQTLHTKLQNHPSKYGFLRDFDLVVFDEAHRSVAPTFTSVMSEVGLTRRQKSNEPFLIGLTATPYRGYNVEETNWLARRYGNNRLDADAFETNDSQQVIKVLQNMRVLAEADHEAIEGGKFSLDFDELMQWEKAPFWLPQSVEERIARDAERTKRIIEAYLSHIKTTWSTLIFATSVEHAQTIAALLNQKGIRSRAVSGNTEPSTRRRVVEEFRSGEIKALVNYGVFREGFDAPKTRAIIVARPVYSPNLYFQMIGRGLRGVKNGGNDRCLILNVLDNIDNFQRALAFSELDWLWA